MIGWCSLLTVWCLCDKWAGYPVYQITHLWRPALFAMFAFAPAPLCRWIGGLPLDNQMRRQKHPTDNEIHCQRLVNISFRVSSADGSTKGNANNAYADNHSSICTESRT